ncbi:cobalamin biosynthesis protein CbiG [Sulfolobus sp. E5-1-F]|uniref:cobalt-precorrin 5A hydrolase n=1 Tax=Saccharolobus sp. E5-1-F TaxID=2663019 RepID=UPI0012950D25|nr:cobalt-precorrin 5A hydrolase [Sulfolobus sp. E5-1-F]QGA55051.1 cobalamin biosynthesis protein CbiG [Sulfolobus sp. E5-1-F]
MGCLGYPSDSFHVDRIYNIVDYRLSNLIIKIKKVFLKILYALYVSRILVNGINKDLVKQIKGLFSELGYSVVNNDPDIIISVDSINNTIRKYFQKFRNKIIINVVQDGSSVIPLTKEHLGGSLISSFLADSLGANLILTTSTGVKGLYSVEEFSWLNGFSIYKYDHKVVNSLNKKLVTEGKINVYLDSYEGNYILYDGYSLVGRRATADLVISTHVDNAEENTDKLYLIPAGIYVGIKYLESTPLDVLVYSLKMTLKSLYILNDRIDYIVVSSSFQNDKKLNQLSKYYYSKTIYVSDVDELYSCETLLKKLQVKVLLRDVRRAFGVITCLGVK